MEKTLTSPQVALDEKLLDQLQVGDMDAMLLWSEDNSPLKWAMMQRLQEQLPDLMYGDCLLHDGMLDMLLWLINDHKGEATPAAVQAFEQLMAYQLRWTGAEAV